MRVIRIAHISGSEKLYSSFSLDSFVEMKAQEDVIFLFFNSLLDQGFVSNQVYYGTRVEFTKVGLGYQLYEAILQQISEIENK